MVVVGGGGGTQCKCECIFTLSGIGGINTEMHIIQHLFLSEKGNVLFFQLQFGTYLWNISSKLKLKEENITFFIVYRFN